MDNDRKVEVLIVGGGPAGSVCGYQLKQAGKDCLIVDRATFPREKVCGGALSIKAWRLLDRLMPGINYDFRPLNHIRMQFEQDPVCELDLDCELHMTNRKDFDYSLLKYYMSAGGEVLKEAFDHYEEQPDGSLVATMKSGLRIACEYLVAADGAFSRVRKQMFGEYKSNVFFIEQYTEPTGAHEIFGQFFKDRFPGCFYKFPGVGRDIWGYNAPQTSREQFEQLLEQFEVPKGRIVGAYIPLEVVQSTHERIIFIGDAGGFANRVTGEGLYDAFLTAYHAKCAIVEHRPFGEVNRRVFEKMRAQERLSRFAHTRFCMRLFRVVMRWPRLVRWLLDTKMKREYWFK